MKFNIRSVLPDALKQWLVYRCWRRIEHAVTTTAMGCPSLSFRLWFLRSVRQWEIGYGSVIGRGVVILGYGTAKIGDLCTINSGAVIDTRGELTIGNLVDISPGVRVLTADHDPDSVTFTYRSTATVIGDRCWLATGVIVLPGSLLGEGTVAAAGAVIRKSTAAFGIYAGNPAKLVRVRSSDAQEEYRPLNPLW